MSLVANALMFQACWLGFVAGAPHGRWWIGFALLLPFALWQLRISRSPRADVLLVGVAALLGFAVDSAFVQGGLMRFSAPVPWPGFAPVWIVGLWMAFALTLNHSLRFLRQRPALALVLGTAAGPLAYWIAANAWDAVDLLRPWPAMAALALAWGVLTPALVALAQRFAVREAGVAG